MLQLEFEERVGMPVSATEYNAIEVVYINADENISKDDFCKMWAKMNRDRIKRYAEKRRKQEKLSTLKDKCWDIYAKLRFANNEKKSQRAIDILGSRDCNTLMKAGVILDEVDGWTFQNRLLKFLKA